MAFESLSDRLQNVLKNLRGKGRLTEADVKAVLKEVEMALLEVDVSSKAIKQFVSSAQDWAIEEDVFDGLTPGQTVIKTVAGELVEPMGSETTEITLKPGNEITIIMIAGLQSAGKTTTTARIAGKMKVKDKKPLLAAYDIYHPVVIKQLQINGEKAGVPVSTMGDRDKPVDIAKAAVEHATRNRTNLITLDTTDRLHINEDTMEELVEVKDHVDVYQIILMVDAITGQDVVDISGTFNEKVGIDDVILIELDSDTRGGAALSTRAVAEKPILYVGIGGKLSDLEQLYLGHMTPGILGVGDIQSLIEKVTAEVDEEQARKLSQELHKTKFNYNDFLTQMQQIKKTGGVGSTLSMMSGMGSRLSDTSMDEDEKFMHRVESITLSMTKEGRNDPNLMSPSREQRIARGVSVEVSEANRPVRQFNQMKKMTKQISGLMGDSKRRGGFGDLDGLMGGKIEFPF